MVQIKISSKSAQLKFLECGPTCIKKKGCKSKCCDAPKHPTGTRIHLTPDEAKNLTAKYGVTVKDGFLQPRDGKRVCPFKTDDYLCSLHGTDDKPFGCIVSPFMLNKNDTLIIRNRYKRLPCYDKQHGQPAYKTFKDSLVALFGKAQTRRQGARKSVRGRTVTT